MSISVPKTIRRSPRPIVPAMPTMPMTRNMAFATIAAAACRRVNEVKGVEIGAGFAAARLAGEQNADPMRPGGDGRPLFLANHAGGVAGGISTGQPVVLRVALKPTSSILTPVDTIDRA